MKNERQADGLGQSSLPLVTGDELGAIQTFGCGDVQNIHGSGA